MPTGETSPIPQQLPVIAEINLPEEWEMPRTQGKVRDVFQVSGGELAIGSTDRLSAFDRILTQIPGRGEVLNRLSQWWFEKTADIVPNHVIAVPDPNIMIVRQYPRIDLEMVVRGYLTGVTDTSIWHRYQNGEREFGGMVLPDGMRKNMQLLYPIVDPTTKAVTGHDQKITEAEILERGIVTPLEWQALKTTALSLFARGQALAARAGLILVDTKYEFGRGPTGNIVAIDEIHTPDSSRYWGRDTHDEHVQRGEEPDIYDKEYARIWYKQQGYGGEGTPPVMPEEVRMAVRDRYISVYERLTGETFIPEMGDPQKRIVANLERWFNEL